MQGDRIWLSPPPPGHWPHMCAPSAKMVARAPDLSVLCAVISSLDAHCLVSQPPSLAGGLWEIGEKSFPFPLPASCPGCPSPGLAWPLPGEALEGWMELSREPVLGTQLQGAPRLGPWRQGCSWLGKGQVGGLRSGCT